MNKTSVSHETKKLKREREQILRKLTRLQESLRTEIDPDFEDAVLEIEAHENAAALIQTLKNRLAALDEALRQSQKGQYGICERCGQPIDPARLEILPETTFCTECKRIVERQRGARTRADW